MRFTRGNENTSRPDAETRRRKGIRIDFAPPAPARRRRTNTRALRNVKLLIFVCLRLAAWAAYAAHGVDALPHGLSRHLCASAPLRHDRRPDAVGTPSHQVEA